MAYSLSDAARATGLNKTTIFRAIQRGEISASRDATTKQWLIEPAELHRVYPPVADAVASNEAPASLATLRNADQDAALSVALAKLAATEQRLADAQDQIADLRRRLDAADAERRAERERNVALLTDQRAQPARRRWWWR